MGKELTGAAVLPPQHRFAVWNEPGIEVKHHEIPLDRPRVRPKSFLTGCSGRIVLRFAWTGHRPIDELTYALDLVSL